MRGWLTVMGFEVVFDFSENPWLTDMHGMLNGSSIDASEAAYSYKSENVDAIYKLAFTLITPIQRVVEPEPFIPLYAFLFVAPSTIMARINDNIVLKEVVGNLTVIGDIDRVSGVP